MKKYVVIFLSVIFMLTFASCASKNSIQTAENYLSGFYQNLNQGNYTAGFYQLNKSSAEQIKGVYEINAEDFIGARSLILGPVVNYEITNSKYSKIGDDKLVDFDIHVEYKRATIDEQMQIIITKDGQTSINSMSFQKEEVTSTLINTYTNAFEVDDIIKIQSTLSSVYFDTKTERNLETLINQAKSLGGNLHGCEVIESHYIYEPLSIGAYVQECMIKMVYENTIMHNKIKIAEKNGELGIGYTMILPERVLTFFETYTSYLKNEDKENTLNLYGTDFFGDSEDNRETKWRRLLSYSEAYGELIDYEVLSISMDSLLNTSGAEMDVLRIDALLNYTDKPVLHELILIDSGEEYVINEQYISSD